MDQISDQISDESFLQFIRAFHSLNHDLRSFNLFQEMNTNKKFYYHYEKVVVKLWSAKESNDEMLQYSWTHKVKGYENSQVS